jgi:hypothetical protein
MFRKEGNLMVKKLMALILAIAFFSLFTFTSAEAGSAARHRWQGAGIALGALALGGLIVHQLFVPPPPVVVYPPPPPPPDYVPGHWEITREWLPGASERLWVPDHYDRYGTWVEGHYEIRRTPGHYVERRVWVEGHYRDY